MSVRCRVGRDFHFDVEIHSMIVVGTLIILNECPVEQRFLMNRKTFERFEFFGHRRVDRLMIGGMKHLQNEKTNKTFSQSAFFAKQTSNDLYRSLPMDFY